METRELRYFVAVAEELHFGRAAARLEMSQPPLSRAVQQLERRLGVSLLRSSHGVTLTEAGSVLLREGRAALDAVSAAERRARRAAATDQATRLVLATKAGASVELLPKLLGAYAEEPDAVAVVVLPAGHHLSTRPRLSLAELDALRDPPAPRWPRPNGTYPDGPGPRFATMNSCSS